MPINPPQPTFNSMATIDFMGMAKAETAFSAYGKLESLVAGARLAEDAGATPG